MVAVTFDFGQTLTELDLVLLSSRLAERGARVDPAQLARALEPAWTDYGRAQRSAQGGHDQAWLAFMTALLVGAGVAGRARELTEWLFAEQRRMNLWRKPIAGMFELVAELGRSGVKVGSISNSEGKLAELAAELGQLGAFQVLADSGVLGIEKPDPRIFEWAADRLGVRTAELVHVGDSWEADVVGALGVGARAVWFTRQQAPELPPSVRLARSAAEVRAALLAWGVPLGG